MPRDNKHAPEDVPQDALIVRSLTVKTDRLDILVEVPHPANRRTSPQLASRIKDTYPELPFHTCINDAGPTFGHTMDGTSTPHLLEHLIIAEQTRNDRVPLCTTLVGTTVWLDENAGLARIEVNFTDDLIVLEALRNALGVLNGLLSTGCSAQ